MTLSYLLCTLVIASYHSCVSGKLKLWTVGQENYFPYSLLSLTRLRGTMQRYYIQQGTQSISVEGDQGSGNIMQCS